jgi:L-malate glycosyltransferase
MKICLFADAGSVHIRQLSKHLSLLGHEIHIVTHKPAAIPCVTVEKFSVPPPGISNLRRWASRRCRYLLNIFRGFDIVNVHFLADWHLDEILPDRAATDARLVATAWGSDIVDPPGEDPPTDELIKARRGLLQAADAITTCGPTFARTVADYAGISFKSICVVPFGVDASFFKTNEHERNDGGGAEVGFFKGFRKVYGPAVLVEAMPGVLAQCPQARFEMIGDGADLTRCQELAHHLGVDHAMSWIGRMEHSRLPERLGRWQLSVIPSIHESFGVAALESQAMGVPVVASRVEGLQDTVRDGETGLLFPVGDSNALAAAIVSMVQDSKLRGQMSRAGREAVNSHYDWHNVADQWVQLYSRVREEACVMV